MLLAQSISSILIIRELNNFSKCRPKIPIVLYTWLHECIDQKMLLPLGNHLVGETGNPTCKLEKITRTQSCHYEASKTESSKKVLDHRSSDPNISFEFAKFPRATISYSSNSAVQTSKRIKVNKSQSTMLSLMDGDLTLPDIPVKDSMPESLKNPWIQKPSLSNNSQENNTNKRNFPIEEIKQSDITSKSERTVDVYDIFQFQIFSGKCFTSAGFSKKQVYFLMISKEKHNSKRNY